MSVEEEVICVLQSSRYSGNLFLQFGFAKIDIHIYILKCSHYSSVISKKLSHVNSNFNCPLVLCLVLLITVIRNSSA